MLKRLYLTCILALLAFASYAQQSPSSDVERLFNLFKTASNFDRTYPREKVYLHLDNSAYIEGDSIFYKAYVVRASSLLPTTLSHVLYVDLLNADGQLMEKQVLEIDSLGQADGCLSLKLPVRAGFYEVRAYTREMSNWGTDACFSRVIPVFTSSNPNEKTERTIDTDITQLSIPEPEPNRRVSMAAPRPYRMMDNSNRLLDFYPEGGWRTQGVMQRVAFKLTDGRGNGTSDTLNIFDTEGNLIATTQAEHEGMGVFTLPPTFTEGYAMLVGQGLSKQLTEKRYDLPHPEANFSLQAAHCAEGVLVDISTAKTEAAQKLLGLAVINREKTCYFDTLTVGLEGVELLIPQKALRGGVSRIELFDTEGKCMASRMIWTQPTAVESRRVKAHVRQNKAAYGPLSPVALDIQLSDAQSRPVNTTFSIAVRDQASNLTETEDGGIEADLLLSSELKGYIHRPDLYFTKHDALHQHLLDLLLMVQGWNASTFEVMCGKDTFQLRQPIEDKLILRGTLYKLNNKFEPQANFALDFKAYSLKGGSIEGSTMTDKNGRFAFESNINFKGEYIAQFTTRNTDGKRRWGKLTLDRWFAPQPRPFYASDLTLRMPTPVDSATIASRMNTTDTFEWKDTLSNAVSHTFKEVEIKAHKKYKGFTGTRYTWNGGEKNGMKKGTKYFNIEWAVEELKDRGHDCQEHIFNTLGYMENALESSQYISASSENPTLVELYAQEGQKKPDTSPIGKDEQRELKGSEKDLNDWLNTVTYKGRAINNVYYDNIKIAGEGTRNMSMFDVAHSQNFSETTSEEIKSVSIVGSNLREDAVTGQEKRNSTVNYSMYIYSLPEAFRFREGRGIDRRRIQGFARHTVFYSPRYNAADLPTDTDLRRTLYWNPSVKTDKDGHANVTFFSNSRPLQLLDISVRGVGMKGEMIQ